MKLNKLIKILDSNIKESMKYHIIDTNNGTDIVILYENMEFIIASKNNENKSKDFVIGDDWYLIMTGGDLNKNDIILFLEKLEYIILYKKEQNDKKTSRII